MPETTTIKIDGRWTFDEFAEFSKRYTQVYSFIHSLHPEATHRSNVARLYGDYPWRGGFSALNFYNELYRYIPRDERPAIRRLSYSSPGIIELDQVVAVAAVAGAVILSASIAAKRLAEGYSIIQREIRKRRLSKVNLQRQELELVRAQMEFIKTSYEWFSSELAIPEELLDVLAARADGDTLAQLKMLLSLYRRIVPIADLQRKEKLDVKPLIRNQQSTDSSELP